MKIGAQLYTIRDFCKTTEDFAESLKKIADIGYKTIQVSGTCEYEPEWLKSQLEKNGIECVVTHVSPEKLQKDTVNVCKQHDIFKCNNVGLGCFMFSDKENLTYADFLKIYKPVAKKIKENGKYFMYHNHDQEFQKIDGKLILQKLSEDFDSNEMGFTLDTFWVQAGGGDPALWIQNLSGRVPCIHLKDYSYGRKMEVIGEGNINFDRVFSAAEKSQTKFMLVEQDDCNGENPFDCLKRSYNNLHTLGFE